MLFQAVVRSFSKLLEGPARFRHANHRHVEIAAPDHLLERRENLFVGEVAGRAKEDQCV